MGSRYDGTEEEIRALNAYIALVRAAESVSADLAALLAAEGLTISQFGVLDALHHIGPMHQNELARKILNSTGNLTTVITNLKRRGLVRAKRDRTDRRCNTVALTPQGRAALERVLPNHVAAIRERFLALDAGEQSKLRELARRLGKAGR